MPESAHLMCSGGVGGSAGGRIESMEYLVLEPARRAATAHRWHVAIAVVAVAAAGWRAHRLLVVRAQVVEGLAPVHVVLKSRYCLTLLEFT